MDPIVSIIMPVYNAGLYLSDAIGSVLRQDYRNWELLVIDDGSSDDSLTIAKSFIDPRIRVIAQTNQGVASARNFGLRIMSGSFFCFLDADDMLTPNSLSLRLSCFSAPDVVFADGAVVVFDRTMRHKEQVWLPRPTSNVARSLVRLDGMCFFGPTWMVKRIREVHYRFDQRLTHGEDLFFYLSYVHLGAYTFTQGAVLNYRRSPGSAMANTKGLANGYHEIGKRLKSLSVDISWLDRAIFRFKARKIIFLCFTTEGKINLAFKYLFNGIV